MNSKNNDQPITLRDIVLGAKEYVAYFLSKKSIALAFVLGFVAFMLYKHFTFTPQYQAELDFVVEGNNSSASAVGGLLGSLGLSRPANINTSKVIEVAKSRRSCEQLLEKTVESGSQIGEQIVSVYHLDENWSKTRPQYEGYSYTADSKDGAIDPYVSKKIQTLIWGSPKSERIPLCNLNFDESSGLFSVDCNTEDEELSIALSDHIYSITKNFFEEEIFESQLQTANILKSKADSLQTLIEQKVNQSARLKDGSLYAVSNVAKVKMVKLDYEISALNVMYSEIKKNLELNDISFRDRRSTFIALNRPFSPIEPSKSSLIKNIIIGSFLGVFLSFLLLSAFRWYQDLTA